MQENGRAKNAQKSYLIALLFENEIEKKKQFLTNK